MDKNLIARTLSELTVGVAVVEDDLAMFPLTAQSGAATYSTLDDAIAAGSVEITEVSAQGSVPELLVVNRGRKPTLIVDGEELVGAKQNRVVNLTILVAASSTLTIPVSCVEAGRWRARSRAFTAAPRAQYAAGRAKRMAQVSRSIADRGERTSDQAEVWADIAEKSERMQSPSSTGAMAQIYLNHAASVDRYVAGCTPVDDQVGALFAIGDRIVGFDLFDSADTLRKLLPKLVRSYAIDALDSRSGRRQPDQGERAQFAIAPLVPLFLAALAVVPQHCAKAVGVGDDARLTGNGLVGAALVVDGRVVHLSGFPA